jgi:hypothetical protein
MGIAVIVIVFLILVTIEVLIFVDHSQNPSRYIAAATVLLAFATASLGFYTWRAVQTSAVQIDLDRQLIEYSKSQSASAETAARAATEQAAITAKIHLASNRPFVTLSPSDGIYIHDQPNDWRVKFTLVNLGTGIAIFERLKDPAVLTLYWQGKHVIRSFADLMVVNRSSTTPLEFVASKSSGTEDQPSTAAGAIIKAHLEFNYTDTSKEICYRTRVRMDLAPQLQWPEPIVAELFVKDIDFEGPYVPLTGSVNITSTVTGILTTPPD